MSIMDNPSQVSINVLSRVLALARPYRGLFLASGVLAIVLAPIGILRPWLVQVMVDDYIFKFDIPGMTRITVFLFGALFLESGLRYFFIYVTNLLGQSVIRDLRVRVFNHITSLRLSYFDQTPIGTSTTRTINDIETINTVFSEGVITILADILSLIAVLAIMFYTSWELTLVCLITMPFLIVASYIFKEKVRVAFQKVRTQISRMNAFMQERISGMRIVQIFNAEEQEMRKFREINREYTSANLNSILYYAVFFAVVEIIAAGSLGLMVWWGARGVISGDVTLGALVAFPIYLGMLFRPIRMLADKFNTMQMGLVAADRVFRLIDRKEKIENNGSLAPGHLQGEVVFENVSFAYNEVDYVLRDISFQIEKGETVALVGATGSGKSTIVNLLNRFYDVQKGVVKVDGADIRDYDVKALRRRLAIVLQDVFLFTGSVMDNITLRDESISREQVIESAKMIGAHEFIERLPGGYDYNVQERGATLSMGQRQLISFVRALVFNPDILILDEATSSVDPETEGVIQFAIEQLISKRTSIIIAHRLSTIRHASRVFVMKKGELAESGAHEELMQIEGGYYRKLYEMQFLNVPAIGR